MPSPSATLSTLQVGTYTPATDTWTSVLDLNDRTNFYIRSGGMKLDQPEKAYVTSFTIRARGERVLRNQYKNRHILASIWIRGANTTAILTNVRNLLAAIEQPPYRLKLALPGASGFSYADCVKCTHNIPSDAQEINAGAINHVEIDFECAPGLSADQASGGTRLSLQNLLMNPGFEAPSGFGTKVFGDSFANFNAYTVQAGGALVQDKFTYVDTVLADSPLYYFRLDETSGTTYRDAMASGQNGTGSGTLTQNQTSLLTGDTDPALKFDGSTAVVALPTTGTWPTGNGAWTLECWCKPTNSTNAANGHLITMGNPGTTGAAGFIAQNSTGGWNIGTWGGAGHDFTGNGTSTAGTTYHVVGIYDGASHLDLYVNNTHFGTFNPGTLNLSSVHNTIGDANSGSNGFWFNGTIDEVAIYNTALSSGRVSAHYTAGTTTPSTTANTMQIPAGGRVSFGSPIWSSINTWQVRFRYLTSLTATFYLHYTDANNNLAATVTGTQVALKHTVAGVTNTLGTQSINLANGMQYWLQCTQFPAIDTFPQAQAQVVLKADAGGTSTPGATVATITSVALASNSVANSGAPQMAAAGAALGIGGNFVNVQEIVLFGPGVWAFTGSTGTTTTAGAWEQNTSNTYPNGPVTSFGALRVDAPPTGGWTTTWTNSAQSVGGLPVAGINAPATSGQTMAAAVWVKTSGLGSGAQLILEGVDADSSGNALHTTTLQTLTGNQSAWTQMTGTWTPGASTAQAYVILVALDSTSGSANGIVWWDNAQLWNQTTTGQTTMPYCELRFGMTPAQLMVSGLIGDIPAPCYLASATFLSSLATGGSVVFGIGRRATPNAGAVLVGNLQVYTGIATAVLDSNSYGGYYLKTASNATAVEFDPPTAPRPTVNQIAGTWHFFERAQSNQATIANVTVKANHADSGWVAYGTAIAPLSTASTWTMVDAGQVAFPIGAASAIAQNPAVATVSASTQWADSTGGGSTIEANWYAYVPVDTNLLYGTILNPSNAGGAITNKWFYVYNDALGPFGQVGVGWRLSQETTALPNPSTAVGGPGTSTSTFPSVNPSADLFLFLDPTTSANTAGVNQLVAIAADNNGAVLPLAVDLVYAPQYLYPK